MNALTNDIEKYIDQKGFFIFKDTCIDYGGEWVVGVTPKLTPLLHWKDKAHKFTHVSNCIEGRGATPSEAIKAAIKKVRKKGRPTHKDVFWPDF